MNRKRVLLSLTTYGFFRGLAVGFYRAFFSYYMKDLGHSMVEIGGVASIAGLVSFLLLPATGSLIDYYSSRATIALTGVLGLVALALLGLKPSLDLFAISYTLFTTAFFLGQPARSTYLARAVPQEVLGFYLSVVSFTFSLAMILGPSLGGFIVKAIGYKLSFIAYSLVWTLGLLFFVFISPRIPSELGRLPKLSEIKRRYRNLLNIPQELRRITLAVSIDRSGWSLWMPMLTAHLYNYGYTEEQIGLIYGVFGVSRTLTMMLWGKVTDIIGSYKVLFMAEMFGAIGTLLVARPTNIYYGYLSVVLIGLSIAAWIPSYNKLVAETVAPGRYGEAYTTTNAYRSLVGIPIPYVGGYLYDSVGTLPLFMLSSVLIGVAGGLFILLGRRVLTKH